MREKMSAQDPLHTEIKYIAFYISAFFFFLHPQIVLQTRKMQFVRSLIKDLC